MQAWGLIVLLVSKAVGHSPNIPEEDQDTSAGVLHTQRALAEITEMIRISFLIHQVRGGMGVATCFSVERGDVNLAIDGWRPEWKLTLY